MTVWVFVGGEDFLTEALSLGVLGSDTELAAQSGDSAVVYSPDDATVSGPFDVISSVNTVDPAAFGGERPQQFEIDIPDSYSCAVVEQDIFREDLAEGGAADDILRQKVLRLLRKSEWEVDVESSDSPDQQTESPLEISDLSDISKATEAVDARKRDFSGEEHGRLRLDDALLGGADLSHVDLEGSTLTGAELRDVDFRGANLAGVDFTDATVDRADFTGADLTSATLSGNLTECEFSGAVLNNAVLSDATLGGAEFVGVQMQGADLRHTQPTSVRFERCDMRGVRTSRGDDFTDTSFRNCILTELKLSGVRLQRATFTDCDLRDVDLTRPKLNNATFADSDLTGADLREQICRGITFYDSDLSDAYLDEVVFEDARFTGSRLNGTRLSEADLSGTVMSDVKASNADFSHSNLERVAFSEAELFGANFSGAAMYGSILQSARIGGNTRFYAEPVDDSKHHVVYDTRSKYSIPDGVVAEPPPIEKAMSVYQALESIMEQNAYGNRARTYFRRRKELERNRHWQEGNVRALVPNVLSWLSCGYGESFGILFAWAAGSILLGAVAYPFFGLSHGDYGLLSPGGAGLWAFGYALQFSLSAFTGLGYGQFDVGPAGEGYATVQTAFGIIFFALFVFVLTRRLTR